MDIFYVVIGVIVVIGLYFHLRAKPDPLEKYLRRVRPVAQSKHGFDRGPSPFDEAKRMRKEALKKIREAALEAYYQKRHEAIVDVLRDYKEAKSIAGDVFFAKSDKDWGDDDDYYWSLCRTEGQFVAVVRVNAKSLDEKLTFIKTEVWVPGEPGESGELGESGEHWERIALGAVLRRVSGSDHRVNNSISSQFDTPDKWVRVT